MSDRLRAPLKRGVIEQLLETPAVTPPTRAALQERLSWAAPETPRLLDPQGMATLRAVCARLVPQPDPERQVDLAARLDARLAAGGGDGWRYELLPPDPIATQMGLRGIEDTALAMHQRPFRELSPEDQDAVLRAVQGGSPEGATWRTLNARLFFVELLALVTELYYAHPWAQERIGYVGMADAQGFHALGLNRRDPIEQAASDAPL